MENSEIPFQKSPISAGESNSSGSQETKNRNIKIGSKKGLITDAIKSKKKSKRKTVSDRKTKPSPVLKVDEETLTTSTSDNTTNTPEELELYSQTNSLTGSNSSSEDDTLLTHMILSHILNTKKLVSISYI